MLWRRINAIIFICSVGYMALNWYNSSDGLLSKPALIALAVAVFGYVNMLPKHTEEEKKAIEKYGYLPDEEYRKKLEQREKEKPEKEQEYFNEEIESVRRMERLKAGMREKELEEKYIRELKRMEQMAREKEKIYANREREQRASAEKKSYFGDIADDWEKIQNRYKALSKAFHPDMKSGNQQMFQELNSEYMKYQDKYQPKNKK